MKCIITDIDRTLTNEKMELSERTIAAVQRAKKAGIQIILCSGRPYQGMKEYIAQLGLTHSISIGFNGGVIFDNQSGAPIQAEYFTAMDSDTIITYLLHQKINFHLESAQFIYSGFSHVGHYTIRDCFITDMPLIVADFNTLRLRTDIAKIMIADTEERLNQLYIPKELMEQFKFVRSRPYYLEIVPKQVNKGLAVQYVRKRYHYPVEEIIAIGDGANDYELLKEAGYAIAMENATEELKQIADVIAPSFEADGFALVVEQLLQKQR